MQHQEDLLHDALRYRWIRDTNNKRSLHAPDDEDGFVAGHVEVLMVAEDYYVATGLIGKEFDDAIDNAMKHQPLDNRYED